MKQNQYMYIFILISLENSLLFSAYERKSIFDVKKWLTYEDSRPSLMKTKTLQANVEDCLDLGKVRQPVISIEIMGTLYI